jgi:hypothetical protein
VCERPEDDVLALPPSPSQIYEVAILILVVEIFVIILPIVLKVGIADR